MKIYLAGPMSGYKDYNFQAFHSAADIMRGLGYEVINPAEMDEDDPAFHEYKKIVLPTKEQQHDFYFRRLREDVKQIASCDAIAVLPGWQNSYGASQVEVPLGRSLKMPILHASNMEPVKETILAEAERLVGGDRRDSYGHPADDFRRTAAMWTAILSEKMKPECKVDADEIPLCMIAVKISRQCHAPKRDNWTDIAGYARTGEMVDERLNGVS